MSQAGAVVSGAEPAGWRWLVLTGSLVGAYLCVPETTPYVWVAWLFAGLLAVEVCTRVRFAPLVGWTCWGLLVLTALYGATGRPSAVLGGLFSVVAPVVAFVAGRADGWRGLVLGSVWVVAAAVVARTGGIARTAGPAWWAVGVGGALAVASTVGAAAVFSAVRGRRRRPAPSAG